MFDINAHAEMAAGRAPRGNPLVDDIMLPLISLCHRRRYEGMAALVGRNGIFTARKMNTHQSALLLK